MNIGVFLHIRFLMEPFSAVLAGVRSGIRVDQQMRRQRARPFKGLTTLLTFEHFFDTMDRPEKGNELYSKKKR